MESEFAADAQQQMSHKSGVLCDVYVTLLSVRQ